MADDEVLISARLQDSISAAVSRIDKRVEELEEQLRDLGRTGAKAGAQAAAGTEKLKDSTDDAGNAARRARPPIKAVGDEAVKTGVKARAGAAGLDEFARKADKAGTTSRRSGRMIVTAFKFAGIVTGVFALAGGLSALGAGGAIAVGGLAPMVGVLAGVPGLFLAAKLGALAFKLAGDQLTPTLDRLKAQFTELGPFVASGGLAEGLAALTDSTLGLAQATGIGLRGFGAEIGEVAREVGRWVRSEPALEQIALIFDGLRPVVGYLARGVFALARAFVNVVLAALPLTQEMARTFYDIAQGLAFWTAQNLANGRATAWLMKAWQLFTRTVGVLVDVMIGVYRVLRVAAGYALEFGLSIEDAARRFRYWTGSAEGQAAINQYFREALPALREMGRLLGMIVGGFAGLAANQDVAPLLSQIRTEFAPALGELVSKLSGEGGLGPALITAATSMVQLFAVMDFSGLTAFVVAVGQLAAGIAWIATNVPGANFVISALLFSMLGFKVLGPVWSIVGKGAGAFSWVWGAAQGTANLSKAQQMLKGVLFLVSMGITAMGTAFKAMALAGIGALRALSVALFTTPVGWIILAIMAVIGVIILLWTRCEWFRDAVTAVWEWIKNAAVVAWEWIKVAVSAVITAIVWYITTYRDIVLTIWNWIASAASATWSAISGFVQGAISVVTAVVMWLWTNAIQPVWNLIVTVWEVHWAVIKFVVQTVVFIIAAIIAGLAWVAEKAWEGIAAGAKWVFEEMILPVVRFFQESWEAATSWISEKWTWLTTVLSVAWQAFYDMHIKPAIDGFRIAWETVSNWVSEKWAWLTTVLSTAWQAFYDMRIKPVIENFQAFWAAVTTAASIAWDAFVSRISELWNGFKSTVGGVIDWVSRTWSDFTSWLGEAFEPLGSAISAIWEGIQKAASGAAEVVKGAWDSVVGVVKGVWNFIADGWNSIPSVTVPDWVPGMGGKTFSLPKLPMLWQGGQAPVGPAIVGEHGPEPVVQAGRVVGMVGMNGPEVTTLPKGGYVVPNLSTLSALPGLTKSIPAGVAAAVARSVPGYADALGSSVPRRDDGLRRSMERLADAVGSQPPPVHLHGTNLTAEDVAEAWRRFERERRLRKSYTYQAGGR
ncbi:MAG: hypothetical protein HOY78_02410 [Saccharothrix sp.]|nr:hypothetical protein [Saccharothrix sp.]